MSTKKRHSDSGSVLLVVLLMMSVLAVVSLETMRSSAIDRQSAAVFRASLQAEQLALSAEAMAKGVLLSDDLQRDLLTDSWARLGERLQERPDLFSTGEVRLSMQDESGLFPLRRLIGHSRKTEVQGLAELARRSGFEGNALAFARAVVDWQDRDTTTVDGSSEDALYVGHAKPPNRPMRSLDELLLVRWEDMKADEPEKVFTGVDGKPGLQDLCTVYTEFLNVNTVRPEVVPALASERETAAAFTEDFLQRREDMVEVPGWHTAIFDFYEVSFPVTNTSSYFRLDAVGRSGAVEVRLVSVLHRMQNEMEVAYRRVF